MNIASVEQSEARGASARCSQNPMKNRVFFIESDSDCEKFATKSGQKRDEIFGVGGV